MRVTARERWDTFSQLWATENPLDYYKEGSPWTPQISLALLHKRISLGLSPEDNEKVAFPLGERGRVGERMPTFSMPFLLSP